MAGGISRLFGRKTHNMESVAQELRGMGFSDDAINFVQAASSGTINSRTNVMTGIMPHVQSSVVQLGATARHASETLSSFRSQQIIRGGALSFTAAALITAELLYASEKTQLVNGGFDEAMINNGGRIAAVTGATAGAVTLMRSKNPLMRLAGAVSIVPVIGLTGAGATQIAHEELSSISIRQLEAAKLELEDAIALQQKAAGNQQSDLNDKRAEIDALQNDRNAILNQDNDITALDERRNFLEERVNFLQEQIIAYNIVIDPNKATPESLEIARQYRERGFEHVGINRDGSLAGDEDVYKPHRAITEAALAEAQQELNAIKNEINERRTNTSQIESLSPADRGRLEQVDARIASLRQEIQEISDGTYLETLQNSVARAQADIDVLKEMQLDPEANIFQQLQDFATTDKGFTAAVSGTSFALLSVMGGFAFESALAAFKNKGSDPTIPRGAVTFQGLPVNSLADSAVVARHADSLQMQGDLMRSTTGLQNTFEQLASNHIATYRDALEIAHDRGVIDTKTFETVSKRLSHAQTNLAKTVRGNSKLIEETAAILRAPSIPDVSDIAAIANNNIEGLVRSTSKGAETAADIARTARAARITANTPVIGVPIGAAALAGMSYFSGVQTAEAALYHEEGLITREGLDAYNLMHESSYHELKADTELSMVDPIGVTILFTLYTESRAEGRYRDWYDTHGQKLSPEQSALLSPSAFETETTISQMINEFRSIIPREKDGQPEILHPLIDLRTAMMEHLRREPPTYMVPQGMLTYHQQWSEERQELRAQFENQFRSIVSNAENFPTLLSLVPMEERLAIITRLAKAETDAATFQRKNPEISAYTIWEDSNVLLRQFDRSALNNIYANADMVNAYIMQGLGIRPQEQDPALRVARQVISDALEIAEASGTQGPTRTQSEKALAIP